MAHKLNPFVDPYALLLLLLHEKVVILWFRTTRPHHCQTSRQMKQLTLGQGKPRAISPAIHSLDQRPSHNPSLVKLSQLMKGPEGRADLNQEPGAALTSFAMLCIFPQIAGSYRGSYFSKIGLLIPKISAAAT